MKVMLAKVVADLMEGSVHAREAAFQGIATLKKKTDGLGGVICVDARGNVGIAKNTPRMARGMQNAGMQEPEVAIE